MSGVHDPPGGANDDHPPPSWKPSDPQRWSMLGLEDPHPTGRLPKRAKVADVLAWALIPPGSTDPIEGIVDGVCFDLAALARSGLDEVPADLLAGCSRRLWTAMKLLRWCDNREPMPVEEEEEPPPPSPSPAPTEADPPASSVRNRDAGPDEPPGHA
jgi:hypothetical protein